MEPLIEMIYLIFLDGLRSTNFSFFGFISNCKILRIFNCTPIKAETQYRKTLDFSVFRV